MSSYDQAGETTDSPYDEASYEVGETTDSLYEAGESVYSPYEGASYEVAFRVNSKRIRRPTKTLHRTESRTLSS